MDKTVLISLPIEQFETVIIDCINSCLKNHKQTENALVQEPEDKFLTIQGASTFLSLSVSTLYSKCSRGEINFYKQGKRLYFSQKELTEYLKRGRVKSNDEIEAEAEEYLSNSKKKANGKG